VIYFLIIFIYGCLFAEYQRLDVYKKITQKELAVMIKKNENTLSNYFIGKTTPDVATMKKICSIFGVSLSQIFENTINIEHIQIISESQLNTKNLGTQALLHKIDLLTEKLKSKEEMLKARDEILKSKDEVISAMKQNNTKKIY
jgi:transcriptional regulator with XRE-family HTH domain